jgi:hypothetical protein
MQLGGHNGLDVGRSAQQATYVYNLVLHVRGYALKSGLRPMRSIVLIVKNTPIRRVSHHEYNISQCLQSAVSLPLKTAIRFASIRVRFKNE